MPKARRRRSARREADAVDQSTVDERSDSTPQRRGRKLEPMALPPPRQPAEPEPQAIPHAPGTGAESGSTAPADRRGPHNSRRDVPASLAELPHVEEPSPRRRDADPSTEAIVGIRRTNPDGTVTDVQTGARGLPAIVAHGHTWTLAIVVAGFVAALIAMVMVVRELRPDPAPRGRRARTERTERFERSDRTCDLVDR